MGHCVDGNTCMTGDEYMDLSVIIRKTLCNKEAVVVEEEGFGGKGCGGGRHPSQSIVVHNYDNFLCSSANMMNSELLSVTL